MTTGTGTDAARRELHPQKPRRPGKAWKLALACLIGAWVSLAGYDLIANYGQLGLSAVGSPSSPSSARPAQRTTAPAARSRPAPSAASSPTWHPLGVVSATAFGPDGTSDGDNPSIAARILDVGSDQPWFSDWYTTSEFGNLQSGTGLLLDMGQPATVANVRLVLGSAPGASVEVLIGNSPSLDLPVMASASDADGNTLLTATHPATGRYVLIWFTRLPPDGPGRYQVTVDSVSVAGASG